MGAAARKGYEGEVGAVALLSVLGQRLKRPRTTSYVDTDTGDIEGLPFVVSVKNRASYDFAGWVDELSEMVARSEHTTGVVIAKRLRRADPAEWYVVTSGALALPLLRAYLESIQSG